MFLLCAVGLLGLTYLLVASKIPHPEGGGRTRSPMSGPEFAGNPALQSLPDRVVAAKQASKQAAVQQSAADLRQLQIQSGIALGIASVVAFTLGWLAAGRILRPLSTITATARRISATSLSERLNLPGLTTSSRNSATPWTACSPAWRPPSRRSGTSWRTPRTSCAPR